MQPNTASSTISFFDTKLVKSSTEALHYNIVFLSRPTGEISFPDEYHGLFTDDLSAVAEGSTLFNVYALSAPTELGGQEELIGKTLLV